MSKGRSLALVTLAYVLAIAVGIGWLWFGPHTGRMWLDTLIADILAFRYSIFRLASFKLYF